MGCAPSSSAAGGGDNIYRPQQAPRNPAPSSPSVKVQQPKSPESPRKSVSDLHFSPLTPTLLGDVGMEKTTKISTVDSTGYKKVQSASLIEADIDVSVHSVSGGHADETPGEDSIVNISNTFLAGRRWVKKKREEEFPVDIKPGLLTQQSLAEYDEATITSIPGLSYSSVPRKTVDGRQPTEEEGKQEESSVPHNYELEDTDAATILPAGQDSSTRTAKVGKKPLLRGFEIGELLGKGAFGKTFQAVRKSDGKVLALKLARCANMDMANHIMAEVLNMIALPKHSNIVRYESCFITDSTERKLVDLGGEGEDSSDIAIGIVMELCAGGDLKQSISTRRTHDPILHYTEDALLDITIPCLQALAHIHSYKVIHRDIKPHNLLLDAGGNVKLADFGEANMGEATELAGTYAYMAPEVISREGYGVGCDIWSLGCVMLDLMTLTFSFERKLNSFRLDLCKFNQEQINELIQESTEGKYSQEVKELLSSMLQKDPRERPTAEECLRQPFVTSWLDSQRFNDDEDRDIFADMNMIASRASHKGCAPMYLAAASGLSQVCRYYFSYGVPLTQERSDYTFNAHPLFAAIEQGHVKTVSTLLELGADPYEEVHDGCHSMIWAAKHGQEAIVRTLVEKGVPVNHRTSTTHKTACQFVLDDLNFDMLRVLLELGVDSMSTDSAGHSIAHVAMIHERNDVIQFLMDRNVPFKDQTTYLHLAASLGKPTMIELLLNSAKFSVDDLDAKRLTPLHAAVKHQHVEAVQKLIQHGADVNHLSLSNTSPLFIASYVGSVEIVRALLDHGADSTVIRGEGSTPLAVACQEGHLEVVKLLLNHGASADTFDKYHRSPLQMALENGHMDVASLLINSTSDSTMTGVVNSHKHLDLSEVVHAMILQGNVERLNQLTMFGADLNQPYMGVTPLSAAVESGNMDICRFLLDKNVNVNVSDLTGRTPLMVSIEKANSELTRLLLSHDADVNLADNRLNTALLLAVSSNQLELISDLLDHKAAVNVPNERGLRPLHVASCNRYLDVVEKLLSCGADPMLTMDDGSDALSLADQAGHLDVVNRLLTHMGKPPVEAVTEPTVRVIHADMANPVEGAVLDARDFQNAWYEGMIAAVQPNKVLIKFWHRGNGRFWSSNNDEWIDRNSSRLAPLGTHVQTDPRFLQALIRDKSVIIGSMLRPARLHYRWTAGRKIEAGALCAVSISAEEQEPSLRVCLVIEAAVQHGHDTSTIWARVRLWDDSKHHWMDYTHNRTVPATDLCEIDESSLTSELTRLANLRLDQHADNTARLERKSTRKYNLEETVSGEYDVGSTVDAQDSYNHWYPAVILSKNESVFVVQFWNPRVEKWWATNYNEAILIDSKHRIAPLHTHTVPSQLFARAALTIV